MAGASRSTVPGEQRVFSLLLALVASPQGLTKRELLSSVYGYAERYRPGAAHSALDRQFERDKDQVRSLGIPIETVLSPEEPENNQLTRYRISKELLQIPEHVRFSARELSLLRAAALAWSESSLSDESRRAAMKLRSLGAGFDVRHIGVAPRLGIPEPAAPALQRAIDEGRVARFGYQLPGRAAPLDRRVAPLRLHRAEGRWHLIAWDLDREDDRVFLLSRIASEVTVGPERYDPALMSRVDAALAELLALRERQTVVVEAGAGSVAEARLAPRAASRELRAGGVSRLELGTLDFRALAEELAGYGDDVTVVGPDGLRDETVGLLELVREQHGAGGAHA